jgi:hypothetical protein
MHENGKIRPVETIVRTGEWGIKENDGESEFNHTILKEL